MDEMRETDPSVGPVEQFLLLVAAASERFEDARGSIEDDRFVAACVMAGESVEAGLLAHAYVFEPELRRASLWSDGDRPLKWTFDRLIRMAVKMRWLPSVMDRVPDHEITEMLAGDVGDAVRFVKFMRNVAAHPAKHVAEVPWLTVSKLEAELMLGIAASVFGHLQLGLEALP